MKVYLNPLCLPGFGRSLMWQKWKEIAKKVCVICLAEVGLFMGVSLELVLLECKGESISRHQNILCPSVSQLSINRTSGQCPAHAQISGVGVIR